MDKLGVSYTTYAQYMFGYGIVFLIGAVIALQLIKRIGMHSLMRVGVLIILFGGFTLFIVGFVNQLVLGYLAVAVIMCVIGISFVTPSAITIAMREFDKSAGTASACLGVMQFSIAGVLSALVSVYFEYSVLIIAMLAIVTSIYSIYCTQRVRLVESV